MPGPSSPVDPADRFARRIADLERAVEDLQRLIARPPILPTYPNAPARDAAIPAPQRGNVALIGTALSVHNGTSWLVV